MEIIKICKECWYSIMPNSKVEVILEPRPDSLLNNLSFNIVFFYKGKLKKFKFILYYNSTLMRNDSEDNIRKIITDDCERFYNTYIKDICEFEDYTINV